MVRYFPYLVRREYLALFIKWQLVLESDKAGQTSNPTRSPYEVQTQRHEPPDTVTNLHFVFHVSVLELS
jgi:hypothetical protein